MKKILIGAMMLSVVGISTAGTVYCPDKIICLKQKCRMIPDNAIFFIRPIYVPVNDGEYYFYYATDCDPNISQCRYSDLFQTNILGVESKKIALFHNIFIKNNWKREARRGVFHCLPFSVMTFSDPKDCPFITY